MPTAADSRPTGAASHAPWLLALVLLGAATFLWSLGGAAIQDSDEAFYAEAGREMVASGDWTVPHFNFQERLQKPILYYWMVAATFVTAGVGEAAARLWAGLAGLGLALLAFAVGRRWYDTDTGLVAGAIVATSFGFVPVARQALPDVPLACFVTLATWAAIEAWRCPPASSRRWIVLSAAAMGLGMLTKGPIAVVLPGAALGVLLAWDLRRGVDWAQLRRPLGVGTIAIGAAVFLVIAVPWFWAITDRLGTGYLTRFFGEENLERFATDRYNERRSPLFYLPIVAGGLLPWSIFGALLWPSFTRWVRRVRPASRDERRLLSWVLGPLAVLMASVGSQPRYILPCLVPLAVLLARAIVTRARDGARGFTVAALVASATMVVLGLLVWRQSPLLVAAHAAWTPVGPVIMIVAGVVSAAGFAFTGRAGRMRAVAIMAVCAAVSLHAFERSVRAVRRPEPVEVIAAAARADGPITSICACGAFARSLTFYAQAPTVVGATDDQVVAFLSSPERVLAAVDSRTLARVEARMGRTFPRLAEVTYLDSAWWQRVDLLRAPDLSRVQRVVLVATRP